MEAIGEPESAYDQARALVEHFNQSRSGGAVSHSREFYERAFSFRMNLQDFFRLQSEFGPNDDQSYPRYEYNASSSTLTVLRVRKLNTGTLTVQCIVASIIIRQFVAAQWSLPAPIQKKISMVTSQGFNSFRGVYQGSAKTPDLAIEFENAAGQPEPKFILEVGYTETYKSLVQDAKLWLEGTPGVCTVLVVDFEETPSFRCPTHGLDDEQLARLGFPQASEICARDFISLQEFGPVTYKGLHWVGNISEASVEVWRRHPISGLATRSGNRIDLLETTSANRPPPELTFYWSEFIDVAPEDNRQISFSLEKFRLLLKYKIKQLAVYRCREALIRRAGLADIRNNY